MLSEPEKQELLRLAKSSSLKMDMKYLSDNRHNPLLIDGKVDVDRWVDFLTDFNEFINHQQKPFRPIIDKVMKL